jgi:isoquinoline 1-oxidoreductase beta subunit
MEVNMMPDRIDGLANGGIELIPQGAVSRRAFLQAGLAVGGGLLLGFTLPSVIGGAQAGPANDFTPNAFIRIDPNGQVTVIVSYVEMGQGTYTSIPMLIAEELEVPLESVHVEHAPPNDKLYANPALGFQATGNSTAIRTSWEPMRRAGASARMMLLQAAAQQWGVDLASCRAQIGKVVHPASARQLKYGALVGAAAKLPLPASEGITLKRVEDFKLIGTPAKRLDTPDKVNGRAIYGIDVKVPGMKNATLAISPE